jgi:ribonuclease HI
MMMTLRKKIIPCEGCSQHFNYYVGDLRPKCVIQIKHQDLILIEAFTKKKRDEQIRSLISHIKLFNLLKYSHPYYRLLAYNDYLIQHGQLVSTDLRPIPVPDQPTRPLSNDRIIARLIDNDQIIQELQDISRTLVPFKTLDFFTDGSYEKDFTTTEFPMGYGWTTSNLTGINVTYNGPLKYFPSSTKAETMAILTALLVCPPSNCSVNIYTDSQAGIDSFYKSKNLHSISPRRFNKINNNILWSSIHYIIKHLRLSVHFIKSKHTRVILLTTSLMHKPR